MLGMDPVLTGSLCFLVLAIVMYVKFIREHHPLPDDDDDEQRRHHKARKSGPVEPDGVPFLHPASPVTAALQHPPPMLAKTPLSPRQAPHHGLAVLHKAHQYKHAAAQQPTNYYNQPKQPMRRRAHSAAANNQNAAGTATATALAMTAAPTTIADPDHHPHHHHYADPPGNGPNGGGLHRVYEHHGNAGASAPRSSHRIDFGSMEFDQDGFYEPQQHKAASTSASLLDVTFDHNHSSHDGFDDDLESRLPPIMSPVLEHTSPHVGSPPPFMIGDAEHAFFDMAAPLPTPSKTEAAAKTTTATIERPFVKDSVPQPAQMQLEVARKARIPLFLHSPMYVRTSAAPIDDQLPQVEDAPANEPGAAAGGGVAMTPRKKDKLPPRCHKNNSLHIDFNELKVGEMIGQGAFGTVHRASWRGTTVAVKILVCQYLTADILEEFETEVQIMSILRHPNICLLMGACLEPPSRCLVIEYLPRGSLWNVLRQETVLDDEKHMTFARDTALGMNYLHSFQPPILHRDLKSPNLLVDTSYAIKISDFGLARVRAHFQTMTGNCGTTQWMAPEVLAAEKYTEKADVFSYGVVCWEIITRACPYEGLCQIQAALGVLNNNLRPTIPASCPPLFKKLMTLCWVTEPEKRPTFEQILEFLHTNDGQNLPDDPR